MLAFLNLRGSVPERRAAFIKGLERLKYEVVEQVPSDPPAGSIFVTWNRIGGADYAARQFEARGLPVLVAENAAWGNDFAGRRWYSLARNFHNTAWGFPIGDPERWDALDVELAPWRAGGETVILPQRGIGPAEVAMPRNWPASQRGRVRSHPGTRACMPLDADLARAGRVVTWGSGAAVKALLWGIPVESHMPNWIGEQDNTDAGRLAMFRRLAWAQWTLNEIEIGTPFARLLDRSL